MLVEENGAAPAAAEAPLATTTTPAPQEAAQAAPAAPETSAASMEDTLRSVYEKLNPARDDAGKFASKDAKPEDATASASPAPAGEAPKMPVSWPKEQAEAWAKLEQPARDYILRRESEFEKGLSQKSEKIKPYEELDRVFEPWREKWALEGATPAVKVQQLLAAQAYLDRSPAEGLAWLANSYGIDLRQLAGAASQGQPQNSDPVVAQLRAEIADLKNFAASQQQREHQAFMSSVQSEIDAFQKSGKAPHFEALKKDIAGLLTSGVASSLPDAYERAVWLNAETRAKAIEEQRIADAEKASKQAEVARRAAGINVRGTPAAAGSPKTMDDTLREVARRHYN
jgi:hypothetical protein